jgi:two-component system sensor histidine kinase PhoQ
VNNLNLFGLTSLRARLLVSAMVVLVIFLGLMGLVLDDAFHRSAEEGVREKLILQVYGLLSMTEDDSGALFLPESMQEPLFNTLGSGLYGLVLRDDASALWRSISALDVIVSAEVINRVQANRATGQPQFGRIVQGKEHAYFLIYRVNWLGEERSGFYQYLIIEDSSGIEASLSSYRNSLWGWLLGVVLALVLLQLMIMTWGLRPLAAFSKDILVVEQGGKGKLEGAYVSELMPLADNLNLLIENERRQRERYRTSLADLAHSLKTPLSIIRNAVSGVRVTDAIDDNFRGELLRQVTRMDELIGYQLERAVAASSRVARKRTPVIPLLEKLVSAMHKVYSDKGLTMKENIAPVDFSGDDRDFMEAVGNLLDNACKFGQKQVRITLVDLGQQLQLLIEDDGPGIAPQARDRVLNRGSRLDTDEPGQGIGLSVVNEIAVRYKGSLEILESDLGGAKISLIL